MPRRLLHHSTGCTWRTRLTWSHKKRELLLLAVIAAVALLGAATLGRASGFLRAAVTSVTVSETADPLTVTITTNTGRSPQLSVFSLREPDRIVADLSGYTWQSGQTARLPRLTGFLKSLRVGQFSDNPPVTRLVLDLAGPAQDFAYHVIDGPTSSARTLEFARIKAANPLPEGWKIVGQASAGISPVAGSEFQAKTASGRAIEYRAMPIYEPASQVNDDKPAPTVTLTKTSGNAAATGNHDAGAMLVGDGPMRYVLAFAVLLLAGFVAIYVRRRFQVVVNFDPSVAMQPAQEEAPSRFLPAESQALSATPEEVSVANADVRVPEHAPEPSGGLCSAGHLTCGPFAIDPIAETQAQAAPDPFEVAQQMIAILSAGDQNAYPDAIQRLVALAVEGHTKALLGFLDDSRPQIRAMVAGVIGEAGARAGLAPVAELLADPEPAVRASVLYALARFGEAASAHADTVRTLLSDADGATREMAVEAVAALVPYSELAAQDVLNLLGDPEPSVREAAALAVLQFAGRGLDTPVVDLLSDFSRRAEALMMLQQAEDSILWQLLSICQSSAAPRARFAADAILYTMRTRWTAEDFTEDLANPDPMTRLQGVKGLGIIGDPTALRTLRQLAETDPASQVRARAREVLSELAACAEPQATPPVSLRKARSEV